MKRATAAIMLGLTIFMTAAPTFGWQDQKGTQRREYDNWKARREEYLKRADDWRKDREIYRNADPARGAGHPDPRYYPGGRPFRNHQ